MGDGHEQRLPATIHKVDHVAGPILLFDLLEWRLVPLLVVLNLELGRLDLTAVYKALGVGHL